MQGKSIENNVLGSKAISEQMRKQNENSQHKVAMGV